MGRSLSVVFFVSAIVVSVSSCSSDDAKSSDVEPGCRVVGTQCVADEGAQCCSITAQAYDTANQCVRSATQLVDCWKVEYPCLPDAAVGCFSRSNADGSTDVFQTTSTYAGFEEHTGTIGVKCEGTLRQEVSSAPGCQ